MHHRSGNVCLGQRDNKWWWRQQIILFQRSEYDALEMKNSLARDCDGGDGVVHGLWVLKCPKWQCFSCTYRKSLLHQEVYISYNL